MVNDNDFLANLIGLLMLLFFALYGCQSNYDQSSGVEYHDRLER